MATTQTPDEMRALAAAKDQEAVDSFDRCDTDGALSQWASGVTARKLRAEADLAENGNRARFVALFTLNGDLVPSWTVNGRYGECFLVARKWDRDSSALEFVGIPKRAATLEKKGYRMGVVERPARIEFFCSQVGSPGQLITLPDWFVEEAPVVVTNGEGLSMDEVWAIRGGADV